MKLPDRSLRVTCLRLSLGLAFLTLIFGGADDVRASILVPQTHYPGVFIEKYVNQLPVFSDFGADGRVSGSALNVKYQEFRQRILPASFYNGVINPILPEFQGTLLWGYNVKNGAGEGTIHFPAATILAESGTPTTITFENNLPRGIVGNPALDQMNYLQRLLTIDQTLHFANPFEIDITNAEQTGNPYLGPQPVVTHLHGGAVPSTVDGHPDQWFTPLQSGDAGSALQGAAYYTENAALPTNTAQFTYPNEQEASTLWYHDHALGLTRINVYAGLAGYYFLRDAQDNGIETDTLQLPGYNDCGTGDPADDQNYEMEFVIQDRMFDTNGELLFPDGLPFFIVQPPHLFWNPEFLGDVNVVNGKAWPTRTVEARRYRVRFLNGSNARFYNLSFSGGKGKGQNSGPTIWVIGTDGGLLNEPVQVDRVLLSPGERYDTIIDFSGSAGQTLVMTNDAKAPFPFGTTADTQTVGQVAQFVVSAGPLLCGDPSFDPSTGGPGSLRPGNPIEPLPGSSFAGAPAIDNVNVQRIRQLTLNENMGAFGPIEALLNNTKWNGRVEGHGAPIGVAPGANPLVDPPILNTLTLNNGTNSQPVVNYLTELPQEGSTEIWQIINLTADAHPIHLHLTQFQILGRQNFNTKQYNNVYMMAFGASAAFPKGLYKPAFGPPYPYNDNQNPVPPESGGIPIIGGNPDITPHLQKSPIPPEPYERGWKDTVIAYPKQVTTLVVRWAPTERIFDPADAGTPVYAFDPTEGPGYVWHCHILDHEDNEMMRPYVVVGNGDNLGDVSYPAGP